MVDARRADGRRAGASRAELALVAATAVHAGFQLTVTAVVYPALAAVPASQWSTAHDAHGRRITPVVGLVYLPLLAALAGAVRHDRRRPTLLAAAASLGSLALTASVAGPLHGQLGRGREAVLVRRLLRVDRGRTGLALVALAAAAVAAGSR
jgi:hypothetical protein